MSSSSSSSSNATASAVRPYTSYNLFFQLEREYILQTEYNYQPKINPTDVFDPNCPKSNYSGPALPSRYSYLILPYDWHIPGKTQRRKRSHRKSHGKVGFHELNELISKAWQVVDDETRTFCTVLSEVEGKKYKKIGKAMKTNKNNKSGKKKRDNKASSASSKAGEEHTKTSASTITQYEPLMNNDVFDVPSFNGWPSSLSSFPQEVAQPLDKISRKVSNLSTSSSSSKVEEFFVPQAVLPGTAARVASGARLPSRSTSNDDCHRVSFTDLDIQPVDMDDDEILGMWRSTNTSNATDVAVSQGNEQVVFRHTELVSSGHCQECIMPMPIQEDVLVPAIGTCASSNTTSIVQDLEDEQKAGIASEVHRLAGKRNKEIDDSILQLGRMSFIDSEYDLFQEIGQKFRKNVIAATQA